MALIFPKCFFQVDGLRSAPQFVEFNTGGGGGGRSLAARCSSRHRLEQAFQLRGRLGVIGIFREVSRLVRVGLLVEEHGSGDVIGAETLEEAFFVATGREFEAEEDEDDDREVFA